MKNVCKKLFSLMLAVLMIVSVLPMTAMAYTEDTVDITVKDTDGKILFEGTDGIGYTMESYFRNFGDWANYAPVKYWLKNADTGTDGQTVKADHKVTRGSTVVIKVKHNDVTFDVCVNNESAGSSKYYQFSVPYGSTFTVNEKIFSKIGLNVSDIKTWRFDGYSKGDTITAEKDMGLVAYIKTTLEGGKNPDIDLDDPTDNDKNDNNGSNNSSSKAIKATIKIGDKSFELKGFEPSNGKSSTVKDILYYHFDKEWASKYEFSHYVAITSVGYYTEDTSKQTVNDTIPAGKTINIYLTNKKTNDGSNNGPSNGGIEYIPGTGNGTDDKVSQEAYKVYLRIYTNNNLSSATRVVDITDTSASDNLVGIEEIESYVDAKFKPSKATTGITIDGVYVFEGDWASDWLNSPKVTRDIKIPAKGYRHGDINLMVMLTNKGGKVSLKSSSTADSSNPKTGDQIFMTVAVMAVSATALAGAYIFTKKRMAK